LLHLLQLEFSAYPELVLCPSIQRGGPVVPITRINRCPYHAPAAVAVGKESSRHT
jgi:hypothetical protein